MSSVASHAGAAPTQRAERLGGFEKGAIAVLLLAALTPASPPSAAGLVNPSSFTSVWTLRPGGGPNIVELALVALAVAWTAGLGRRWRTRSALDQPVLVFASLVAVLQLVALARNGPGIQFMRLDVERVALVVAGYLMVSRMEVGRYWAQRLVGLTAGALAAAFLYVTIRHGLLGSTEFGTASGRRALLITEDSLLVLVPVVVAWGLLVDRLVRGRLAQGAIAFLALALAVNLLSLRRGGLIFLTAATAVRSIGAPRRWLLGGLAVLLVAAAVGLAAGPARPLVDDLTYVVKSSLLRSKDRSTNQRQAEIENFRRNLHGPVDVALGRGLGAVWNADVASPVDVASFGSGETEFVRVGWHVYGLDWLYKIGILGVLGALFLTGGLVLRARRAVRELTDPMSRSLLRSLAVIAPVLMLFVFTNARVALFAGIALGLGSKLLDVSSSTGPNGRDRLAA